MTFNGKNSLKTTRLAFERANYDVNAFADDKKQVVDFNFAEKSFYGRVNRRLEPVILKEDFLSPISISGQDTSTHSAVNFVSDQFFDMEAHFAKACRLGVIPNDDPILSSLKVVRAYEDPKQAYFNFSRQKMREVVDYFLSNNSTLKSYEDFLRLFLDFIRKNDSFETVTLSDFMKSKNSNIFMSGIALDIGGLSFSDDSVKEQRMLKSPAFQYYLNIANQYGFSVNRRNPGVIISDLAHPITSKYRARYDILSVQDTFNLQYDKTLFLDLDLLNNLLIDSYNTYVNNNPYISEYKSCNNKTITSITNLNYKIDNNINNNLINIYINIKNMFEVFPFSDSELRKIINTAFRIDKLDRSKMLIYIEDQFKAHYNQKDGSLTYYKKRFKNT